MSQRAPRDFGRFIGISLGGGRGKTTAVARLEFSAERGELVLEEARARREHRGGGKHTDELGPFRDGVLLDYLKSWVDDNTVVAIDAPLTLPPCIRCELPCPGVDACQVSSVKWMRTFGPRLAVAGKGRDPKKPYVTAYTQRPTEIMLERVTLSPREALGQGMGPLAARAAYLRRAMSQRMRLNENLLEVHPRATLIQLFGAGIERKTRYGENLATWEVRKQILSQLSERLTEQLANQATPGNVAQNNGDENSSGFRFDRVWPELVVRNVHVFHAVIASISAYLWARDNWRGPSDLLQGRDDATLQDAIDQLGDAWLSSGWIWTPPQTPVQDDDTES